MDWQEQVFATLDSIENASTHFCYPQNWPEGTVITYAELQQEAARYEDDEEILTKLQVKVDVYDASPERVKQVVREVKSKLKAIGLNRTHQMDLYETDSGLHHKTMRFAGLLMGDDFIE